MDVLKSSRSVDLASHPENLQNRTIRDQLFAFAYLAFNVGDYHRAGQRFQAVLDQAGWEWRSFIFKLCCALPFGMTRPLRGLKHFLLGKTPRLLVEIVPNQTLSSLKR